MGFPVGYTEVFLPKLFIHTLSLLGFIRTLIFSLFRFLGLSDFLEPDVSFLENTTQRPENPPLSAILIREILPVVKFEDLTDAGAGDLPESCAVCLYEFECGEEIRWLTNCKHIFHRACLDRWMDHDQQTCPLCRTPFVPHDLRDEFNQRLWAASGISQDFYGYEDQMKWVVEVYQAVELVVDLIELNWETEDRVLVFFGVWLVGEDLQRSSVKHETDGVC
ncbi:unnamed protein product [Ilex paraguariensis]|uniref:RING-type domain-containing protein n=1 Tax=Ilex paraguariensis TaxID=185542 RepID=A0ABC8SHR7_9AQUA